MNSKLAAFSTAAVLALQPLRALAQQTQQPAWDWPGPWHMWSGGWGFWWFFPLMMLFMLVVCAAMFLFGHRWGGGLHRWGPWGPGREWGDPTQSALQILNERFARGEIQKAEYEEKKAAILSGGQH
jgi:putative membrane protein